MPPTILPISTTSSDRRKGNRQVLTTIINVAGREIPMLDYFKDELRLCPYSKGELLSASGSSFALLREYANVCFVPFMGYKETEQARNEHQRNRVKGIFKCFKDAITDQDVHYQSWNGTLAENEQKQMVAEFSSQLFHNWTDNYSDRNERFYEEIWQSPVEKLLTDIYGNLEYSITKDRLQMKLPKDLCLFGKPPCPDYLISTSTIRLRGPSTPQLPLFYVGGKGADRGIDSSVPQDVYVAYSQAQTFASLGVPVEEVSVLHAAIGTGLVTQFFVSYWSDFEPLQSPPDISRPQSIWSLSSQSAESSEIMQPPLDNSRPRSVSSLSGASEKFPKCAPSAELIKLNNSTIDDPFGFPAQLDTKKPPTELYRRLVCAAITKKLDPADEFERNCIARCFWLCGRFTYAIATLVKNGEGDETYSFLRAAAEPKDDDWDDDEDESCKMVESNKMLNDEYAAPTGADTGKNHERLQPTEYQPLLQ